MVKRSAFIEKKRAKPNKKQKVFVPSREGQKTIKRKQGYSQDVVEENPFYYWDEYLELYGHPSKNKTSKGNPLLCKHLWWPVILSFFGSARSRMFTDCDAWERNRFRICLLIVSSPFEHVWGE